MLRVTLINREQALLIIAFIAVISSSACSETHNLLLGRAAADVGNHKVVVTDCYTTAVAQVETLEDAPSETPGGKSIHRFKPCLDADVLIKYEELFVNGKSYGRLQPSDAVTIDHHKVLINEREATQVAAR